MSHEIDREFPASSHTVTPLPETTGFFGGIISLIRTRGLRYALVAAVNILGLIGWVVILPRVEPIDWSRAGDVSRE